MSFQMPPDLLQSLCEDFPHPHTQGSQGGLFRNIWDFPACPKGKKISGHAPGLTAIQARKWYFQDGKDQ